MNPEGLAERSEASVQDSGFIPALLWIRHVVTLDKAILRTSYWGCDQDQGPTLQESLLQGRTIFDDY